MSRLNKKSNDGNHKSKPSFRWLKIAMLAVFISLFGLGGNAFAQVYTSLSTVYVPEGGSTTFDVWVDVNPGPLPGLVVNLSHSGDADITFLPNTLTFHGPSWANPQIVTVSAAEDVDAIIGTANIEVDAGVQGLINVTANEIDNDTTYI